MVHRFPSFDIDEDKREFRTPHGVVRLQPKVFDLLAYLATHRDRVVSKDELLDTVWHGVTVADGSLQRAVSLARSALAEAGAADAIRTFPAKGYRLVLSDAGAAGPGAGSTDSTQVTTDAPHAQPKARPEENSIAVLAFLDMSPARDQEYFSDGISEELLNLLAKVSQLRVIARTSSFAFKGKDLSVAEIARQLNVAYVLEGSVRRAGRMVRVTAQLIRTDDSMHVWSETYDRPLDDIFAVQDEIAGAVVAQLKIKLLGASPSMRETKPEAFALYLQARQLRYQHSKASLEGVHALLDQVHSLDPEYAPAWSLRASTYATQAGKGVIRADDGYRRARHAANRALALAPESPSVHAMLGWIAMSHDRDLPSAAWHLERALALSPNLPDVLGNAAALARVLGRLDQSAALLRAVIARDPTTPLHHLNLGYNCYAAGRYDLALASLRTALTLSPGIMLANSLVARAQLYCGKLKPALAAAHEETSEPFRLIALTMIFHRQRRRAESDAALAEIVAEYANDAAYNIAYLHAFRGDADQAFGWLDRAATANDPGLTEILIDPEFAHIRDDPRWAPFLLRVGMAPEHIEAIALRVDLPK